MGCSEGIVFELYKYVKNEMNGISPNSIAIIMCTCAGERFLSEQLDSFIQQSHPNWSLWVSDDGSEDRTKEIVTAFQNANPDREINFSQGPVKGYCENFLSLLRSEAIDADYVAISDQDDIWLPDKLARSIEKLEETGAALYGGRTKLIDEHNQEIGLSPLFVKEPSLENAVVQSIMGGNTMVITREGLEHFRRSPEVKVVSHDWWLYLFLTASGFGVYYDEEPMTLYRQHQDNLIGANIGVKAKLSRLRRLMRSEFKNWNTQHVAALMACEDLLSEDGRNMIKDFEELQNCRGRKAVQKLHQMNLTRQTRAGELALDLAAWIGRV